VRLVAWRRGMLLMGGDWEIDSLVGRLNGGGSEFGLDVGSIIHGKIPLGVQKVDVRPSLGDKVGDEG
jgi:hypothetical protein